MSASVTTYIAEGTQNTTVVIPASTPMKILASPAKALPQIGAKSRVKNTPRRGKPPGNTVSPTTLREPNLYNSRGTSSVAPAIARPVSTPSVPVILNSQPCSVLLVSETPPASAPSILVSGQTSQSTNVQTLISSAGEISKVSRQAKIVYAGAPLVYTTANSSQTVLHSPASNPKPSEEVQPEILNSTFQSPKLKTSSKPTKLRNEVVKNKPVLPKVNSQNSMVIDLPPTSTNFVIPANEPLTFHQDNTVEVPSTVGYTINITDILPPKPSPHKPPSHSPPKLKPAPKVIASGAQTLPSVSSIAPKMQLLPKETISVKSQSKMIAPQATIKLPAPMGSQATSYIQFQTNGDSNDISVIPITILSSSSQQPITLDSQGIHSTQFISQVPVPQLVPFQTLAPSQDSKLSPLPDEIDSPVEPVQPVEIAQDVSQDDRVPGGHIADLHHGLTKNVPEPYAADILSQLTPDGSLPAISSSQVSSVLSALDTPQQQSDAPQQFNDQSQPQPPKVTKKKVAVPRKNARKTQPKGTAKKKEEMKKEKQDATSELVERVQCFKCRFCLFLTLDSAAVTKHIEEEHSSHLSKTSSNGSVIPCPGCSNVFVSEKSLSVHLREDHKVALRELNDIMSTLLPSKDPLHEEESKKKAKPTKEKAKRAPRASAKIRVRNLMKEAAPPEEKTDDAPSEVVPSSEKRSTELVDKPVVEDNPSRDDLDDHDYATVLQDDSNDGSDNEKVKKRGRKRKKGGGTVRKKRKVNPGNENDPDFLGANYKCSVACCGVRMKSYDNLVYHQRCHKKKEQPVAKCEASTEASVDGAADGEEKSPPKSRKMEYSCPECNLVLRSWVHMSGHLWRSHNIDMELHSCDQCGYKTPSLSNMVNLHQRIHGSERPFTCDLCERSFKTKKQLRNHKVVHANQMKAAAGEASVCEVCGRLFADTRILRSHISVVHNKLKPFTCQTCGYAASSRSTLKMHMRLHTGEKPFVCDVCSYRTADHNSLRRHKKRHSGEKPYKCPHCFYACIQSSTYKVHIRTKHPGQGEGLLFTCHSCPFHTVSYDIYRTHTAQHRIPARDGATSGKNASSERKQPKVRIQANNGGNSTLAVATAAVSDPLPIILSFSTEDAHASEAPNIHSVVEEVSEAIIPGSDLHLLYSNFAGFNESQTTEVTTGVVYGSQTTDFVMSMLGDSVIQVVNERNNGPPPLVALPEERITGDLGELQENTEDLKFKLCEEVRS